MCSVHENWKRAQDPEWKRLTAEAMHIVRAREWRAEPCRGHAEHFVGTLQYEIFFNADESEAIVFERYRVSDAALEHLANIGHLMAPLMETATITGDQPKLFTPWLALSDNPA